MCLGTGAALALWVTPFEARACESLPRTTLALYDGTREREPRDTRIHRFAEIALNHLGHRVIYHDVASAGVPAVDPGSVGLVLSWFDEPPADAAKVWEWIGSEDGFCGGMPKILAFGATGIGAQTDDAIASRIGQAMGIQQDGSTYAIGSNAFLSRMDNNFFGFEAEFVMEPGDYPGVHAGPDGRSLLRIGNETAEVDLAVLGPAGGYVHASAAVDEDGRGGAFWIIDPFALFQHVLGTAPAPIPDPTTLAGRRVFFTTVGADGWLDLMPARAFGEAEQLASEVLVERLVEPFADLPITVAPLPGDLDANLGGRMAERGRQAAARALSGRHVARASQGYSDVRNWDFFAAYDPSREAEILGQAEGGDQQGALMASAVQTLGAAFANTGASAFSRTPNAPRKYATAPFDLAREIAGSLEGIGELAEEEGPAEAFVWGGNARPFEGALAAAEAAGVESIGGGGGTYYAGNRSLTGLWPFAAPVGEHLQVYDGLSGDAAYTGSWTAPLYGFHGFGETLQRTEEPRRLKPFHLSFAARSAMFFETRRAIERYLEQARTADVIPVHAARYARMVRGFQSMRIQAEAESAWRILDRGDLQTVRFDAAAERVLDLAQSTGVLGARRKGESLYVALDPAAEAPLVVLAEGSARTGMILGTAAPALASSRVEIAAWHRTACSVEVQVTGVAGGPVELVGTPGGRYRVRVTGDQAAPEVTVIADAAGRMSVYLPIGDRGAGGASIQGPCEAGG